MKRDFQADYAIQIVKELVRKGFEPMQIINQRSDLVLTINTELLLAGENLPTSNKPNACLVTRTHAGKTESESYSYTLHFACYHNAEQPSLEGIELKIGQASRMEIIHKAKDIPQREHLIALMRRKRRRDATCTRSPKNNPYSPKQN